jgi:2-(1,2-epoxy-1,2-dihydrophenyl)acetyl-CoA isomerase
MSEIILDKRADGVGLITINRPQRMNALSAEVHQALRLAIADCSRDPAVRCVALTGTGNAFCAGTDVKSLGERQAQTQASADPNPMADFPERVRAVREGQEMGPLLLHTMPKPTVAIVNGMAIGLGFSYALSCDIRIMGSEAKMSTGYRNLALSGDYGGTYFLAKLVGDGIARELLFTGEMMTAERAHSLRIANRIHPQASLMDEALKFCRELAQGPTAGMALVKENLNAYWALGLKDGFDFEARTMILGMKTSDHYEAVRAFAEKRKPVFKGQ